MLNSEYQQSKNSDIEPELPCICMQLFLVICSLFG